MADSSFPKIRRDVAQILKNNEFNIPDTADEILAILNLEGEKYELVCITLRKIQLNLKKSKKIIDQLNSEWWNCEIPWKPMSLKIPSGSSMDLSVRKNLFSVRLQQRIRLSSILEQIREIADFEGSTSVEIAPENSARKYRTEN